MPPDVRDTSGNGDEVSLVKPWNNTKVHDFGSDKACSLLLPTSDVLGPTSRNITLVPNIGLNLSGQQMSHFEFRAVALVGVVLQLGVIVFAGAGVNVSHWKQKFENDRRPVLTYAFPFIASSTVAFVIEMFMCCYIIEQCTTEATWYIKEPEGYQIMVAWLQKGGEVVEQQFKSFILNRDTESSKFWSTMPVFVKTLFHTDTQVVTPLGLTPMREQAKLRLRLC